MAETVVANDTRLEILRLVSEIDNPIGADTLAVKLEDRGISLTPDAVRYHLRMLDQQKLTYRIGKRGRMVTPEGWRELRRSRVDTRIGRGLARQEMMAQQVTFDPYSRRGQVAVSLAVFPVEDQEKMVRYAARVAQAGLCLSERMALVSSGDRVGSVTIPPGKGGIITVSTSTITGILASQGFLVSTTYAGIAEIADWRPFRFVDVFRYGQGSLDSVESLIRPGSTRVGRTTEQGRGLVIADVRELVGVARERAHDLLKQLRGCGIGGVLMVGQVGQPVLGVPVRDHTFGVASLGGVNASLAAYEAGIDIDFHLVSCLVDYSSLRPAEHLLPEADVRSWESAGSLVMWE